MTDRLVTTVSTRKRGNYKIMKLGVDSKQKFRIQHVGGVAPNCSFRTWFEKPIILTGDTEIYLQSIWIGGYKINFSRANTWDDQPFAVYPSHDVIYYFSLGIPQFNIDSVAAEWGNKRNPDTGLRDISGNMNRRFNLVNEDHIVIKNTIEIAVPHNITETEFRPFTLGHLNKKSVFVSKLKPQTLTHLDIDIKDQDGFNIWHDKVSAPIAYDFDNPPALSRRVIMEFVFLEKLD